MTTKKQRRANVAAKREQRQAEDLRIGLEAQQHDRARRVRQSEQAQAEADRINQRHREILARAEVRAQIIDRGVDDQIYPGYETMDA